MNTFFSMLPFVVVFLAVVFLVWCIVRVNKREINDKHDLDDEAW